MSYLCPNLQMRIHFLYSVTISNDSAIYFIEISVLISWKGTLTQIRMGIASHSTPEGPMMGQYVFFMPKTRNFYMTLLHTLFSYYLQRLFLLCP